MDNLSKEMRLIAAVVTHEAGTDRRTCALMRVALDSEGGLDNTGDRLGFSSTECSGIADGWDLTSGRFNYGMCSIHRADDPEAYDRGFELGKRCWEAVSK